MRKERGDLIDVDDLVDSREDICEVLDGIHADARARDDERVEKRELFAGLFAVDKEKAGLDLKDKAGAEVKAAKSVEELQWVQVPPRGRMTAFFSLFVESRASVNAAPKASPARRSLSRRPAIDLELRAA